MRGRYLERDLYLEKIVGWQTDEKWKQRSRGRKVTDFNAKGEIQQQLIQNINYFSETYDVAWRREGGQHLKSVFLVRDRVNSEAE